jgi:2'-5' RNA ligase
MRLFAAIVPPRPAVEELVRTVRSVKPAAAAPVPTRKGLRARFGGVRNDQAATAADHDQLVIPDVPQLYLPITSFGNVTLGDSRKLAGALRAEAARWGQPEVRFAGGAALEWRGDENVWAKLDGDVDGLGVIGRGVPQVVQRLGFFVDRRQFRPWLAVGTITEKTTAPYLEALVTALENFKGDPWIIEGISLMKGLPESETADGYEEMERMPLAP